MVVQEIKFTASETIRHLDELLNKFKPILKQVRACKLYDEKIKVLNETVKIQDFLREKPILQDYLEKAGSDTRYFFYALIALDQGHNVFDGIEIHQDKEAAISKLLEKLSSLESFYEPIGGIIGYHCTVLELLKNSMGDQDDSEDVIFSQPPMFDIRTKSPELSKYIIDGIRGLESLVELYPVGGAGDRLNLMDDKKDKLLPVARLAFLGRTLIDVLIRDLEGREYLYYKLFNRSLITPIVLMTSEEKNNTQEIKAIFEDKKMFGRPKESIFILPQPLVPVITIDGNWAVQGALDILVKPGGHGVIWKLIIEEKILEILNELGKKYFLVRQINNPIAGLACGLLALAGYGLSNKKEYGSLGCERQNNAAEGVNVLVQKNVNGRNQVAISNIEYVNREKKYTKFLLDKELFYPANTNVMFVSFSAIKEAEKKLPFPGMMVNTKTTVNSLKGKEWVSLKGARLETTMQNISDALTTELEKPFNPKDTSSLKSFILLQKRAKTISTTKKSYKEGSGIEETPEGAFYDLLYENNRMLKEWCNVDVFAMNSREEYLRNGPSLIFLYHPALGPLYSVISQKLHGGKIDQNSEFVLEVAEALIQNLHLSGSLIIEAERIAGKTDNNTNIRSFSKDVGKVFLKNVTIQNRGINRDKKNNYWKAEIDRFERCCITLEGNSEFYASDITLTGNINITVPDGMKAYAFGNNGKMEVVYKPLRSSASWNWHYTVDENDKIILSEVWQT